MQYTYGYRGNYRAGLFLVIFQPARNYSVEYADEEFENLVCVGQGDCGFDGVRYPACFHFRFHVPRYILATAI